MGIAQTLDFRTSDKQTPRSFFWIWYIRIFQIVITLVVLAIAAANIASFGNINCSVPGKLAWNLACAVLSFLVLMYFLFSTGPRPVLKVLPWFLIGQIVLDFVMLIFWLSASAVSRLNCDDQCGACNYPAWVDFDGLYCTCTILDYTFYKRDAGPSSSVNPSAHAGGLEKRARGAGSAGTRGAKTGLDAILVVLFFATLCAGVLSFFQHFQAQRRNNNAGNANGGGVGTTGGVTSITQEPKYEENGMPQSQPYMQQTTGQQVPQQPQPIYNNNNTQPQSPMGQAPPPNNNYYPLQQAPPQPQEQPHPQQGASYQLAGYEQQQQQQPVNSYGGGSGPQASYPGPEPQGQHFGFSEMGHSDPAIARDQTVSPELQGSNTVGGSHPAPPQ